MKDELPDLTLLADIVAKGLGKAAAVLGEMLESPVSIMDREYCVLHVSELPLALGIEKGEYVRVIEMGFSGGFEGTAHLVFMPTDAERLADRVTVGLGLVSDDIESIRRGTLSEIGNIVINAILGTMANDLGMELTYMVPLCLRVVARDLVPIPTDGKGTVVLIRARFSVAAIEVDGDIIFFLSLSSLERLALSMQGLAHG
jgi:chemotaxis protein CheC